MSRRCPTRTSNACLLVACLLASAPAGAAVFVVDALNDAPDAAAGDGGCATAAGTCTLRAAVQAANALPGQRHEIRLPAGTIRLDRAGADENVAATGDLDVRADVSIIGAGPDLTTVDASALGDRVMHVLFPASDVLLSGLGLVNATDSTGGSGLRSAASVVELIDCRLEGNAAISGRGGGILLEAGSLALVRTEIAGNSTAFAGGGIAVEAGGTLSLLDSSVTDNVAPAGGGGGIASSGRVTVEATTIALNDAAFGGGGGILVEGGTLSLAACAIADNTAGIDGLGGGIEMLDGDAVIVDSTLERNEARQGGAARVAGGSMRFERCLFAGNGLAQPFAAGGAIMAVGGDVTLVDSTIRDGIAGQAGAVACDFAGRVRALNSTFSGNHALDRGGALVAFGNGGALELIQCTVAANRAAAGGGGLFQWTGGTILLGNSVVAGNASGDPADPGQDCLTSTAVTSLGHDLVGKASGCVLQGDPTGNILDRDALLEPLADNGGPTPTHLPAIASPAIDAGNPAGCVDLAGDPLSGDQRGSPRPIDGDGDGSARCDMGAVEAPAGCPLREPSALDLAPGATPLSVARSVGGDLALSWEPWVGVVFNLHRGTLPPTGTLATRGASPYDHAPASCRLGVTSTVTPMEAGDAYFIVVASCDGLESSYGRDSLTRERPPATPSCP